MLCFFNITKPQQDVVIGKWYEKTIRFQLKNAICSTAPAIDNRQNRFVDLNQDTSFSSPDDINYICFSDDALNQINTLSDVEKWS